MRRRTNITGRYRIMNEVFLRKKANRRFDPRHKFYEAMLSNETYEAYLAAVGESRQASVLQVHPIKRSRRNSLHPAQRLDRG
jgi:hypothetical protein